MCACVSERETDRQTDRQADRQTDRQIFRSKAKKFASFQNIVSYIINASWFSLCVCVCVCQLDVTQTSSDDREGCVHHELLLRSLDLDQGRNLEEVLKLISKTKKNGIGLFLSDHAAVWVL